MFKLNSRKLWFAIAAALIVAVMTWFGKVSSTDFIEFLKWDLGIYVAGNVGAKFGVKQ